MNHTITNCAYIPFMFKDHQYHATCHTTGDLINFLSGVEKSSILKCGGVEFVRGSKYFKRQIKWILKNYFNMKKVEELTSNDRHRLQIEFVLSIRERN